MGHSRHSLGAGGGLRVDAAASDSATARSAKNKCASQVSTLEAQPHTAHTGTLGFLSSPLFRGSSPPLSFGVPLLPSLSGFLSSPLFLRSLSLPLFFEVPFSPLFLGSLSPLSFWGPSLSLLSFSGLSPLSFFWVPLSPPLFLGPPLPSSLFGSPSPLLSV